MTDSSPWHADFFDFCPDALCVAFDERLLAVNDAFLRITGYTRAQLIGHSGYEFVHPEDLSISTALINQLKQNDGVFAFENRWRCPDESYIWLSWATRLTPAGHIYCTVRDITQLKHDIHEREQNLRRSEERYRALLQSQSDLVCRFLPDTTLTFVNEAYAAFYGSTPAEMIGRSFLEHVDPDTIEGVYERLEQLRRDPTPSLTSFPWTSPSGRVHWLQWVDQGILDEDGNVVEFQAVGRDITHLKDVEHALRVQQERYRDLFEFSPLPMWVYDRDTLRFLEVNKAAVEKYGYSREEFLSLTIDQIRPANEVPRLMSVLRNSSLNTWVYHGKHWRHMKKDGTVFDVEISSHDVDYDGRKARLVLANDVTEQITAEQALRDSEEKFRTMLEAISQGVMLLDAQGNICQVNVYIETLFGYDRTELVGKPAYSLVPDDMRDKFTELQAEFAQSARYMHLGEQFGLEVQHRSGRRIPTELTLTPATINGQPMIICLLTDLTERKQLANQRLYVKALEVKLEKDRELLNLKERFISTVSHEFRTPLAVILSSVGILRRYHANLSAEKAAEKLEHIATQVRRMVQLLEDVLTISKGNAERIEFRPEPIDVQDICTSIAETIRQADNHQHPILVSVPAEIKTIRADRRLLEHILINLLTNATKYSPVGSHVRLRVSRRPTGIAFIVQDKGIGIPVQDQAHLFEPFHRAGNVSGLEGTGLGLAIVKQSVEEHGGTITFESIEGKGTTFTVLIPV
jgi:PAS domain S-box-containing protein